MIKMTNLTQQLEDKKKGCGVDIGGVPCGEFIAHTEDEDGREWGKTYYCKHCHSEIAILEQAIAEMQNITISNHSESKNVIGEPHLNCPDCVNPLVTDKSSVVSNLLQKQRQEILDIIENFSPSKFEGDYRIDMDFIKKELIEQLNQPKTENDN